MPAPRRWLHSAPFDLSWFAAPPVLAALAVLCIPALRAHDTPLWGWLVFVVFIDVGHVYASLYRTYLDPSEFARRRGLYLGVPVACWVVGAGLYVVSPLSFWRALAYLAVFHFVRQSYGFMRAYSHMEGPKEAWELRLEAGAIYATMLYPLIYWHSDPSRRFWWFVQGDFVTVRGFAGPWASWAYSFILVVFSARQVQRARAGLAVSAGKLAVVFSTAAAWYVGIVATNSDFAFTLTNVVAHGVPYYALTWLYGRRRWHAAGWRRTWHRPTAVFAFVGLLLLFAYIEEGVWDALVWKEHAQAFFGMSLDWTPGREAAAVLIPLLALPQAVHYISDSWLWKFDGSNPGLSEALLGLPARPVRAIIPEPR
jgi:hypothetical protein